MKKSLERFPMPERKSGLVRIIGVESDIEQELLKLHGKFFETKQEFLKNEIKKTAEQKTVIDFINQNLPEFIKSYGAEPLIIPEDKIHLLPATYFQGRGKETLGGFYSPGDQSIYFKDIPGHPLLGFAKRLVHEMMHWNAFQSIQFGKKEGRFRRAGLKIIKGAEREYAYFMQFDEALMEELTKKFSEEFLRQTPILKEDFERIEIFRRPENKKEWAAQSGLSDEEAETLISDVAFITAIKTAEDQGGVEGEAAIYGYSYPEERKKLNALIDELYEKNKNDFQSREEVFALFAKAVLSSRLLPVARLIEKTFGKGSFRRLGEKFGGKMEKI